MLQLQVTQIIIPLQELQYVQPWTTFSGNGFNFVDVSLFTGSVLVIFTGSELLAITKVAQSAKRKQKITFFINLMYFEFMPTRIAFRHTRPNIKVVLGAHSCN